VTFPLDAGRLQALVHGALDEDGAWDDVTTRSTVAADRWSEASIVARAPGVTCGAVLAVTAMRLLDPSIVVDVRKPDGSRVARGDVVLAVHGPARGILSAERVALNYMQRLSGIATLTEKYVDAIRGTRARILDTRKTTPGLRLLEKYAVRCGGGQNHRLGLADAILIKDNHLLAVGGDVERAVSLCRAASPGMRIEVECDAFEQVERAVEAGADMILLDNMSIALLRRCVDGVAGRAILEASGGVTLDTVHAIAATGVDYISVGALTHSAPALDLALDFE
jgi:nicotinate-nucleotide pyrophosphorylase (carboxylating)